MPVHSSVPRSLRLAGVAAVVLALVLVPGAEARAQTPSPGGSGPQTGPFDVYANGNHYHLYYGPYFRPVAPNGSGNVTYHNGSVYLSGQQNNIFWEADNYSYTAYNGHMNSYLTDSSGTGYRANLTQYYEIVGGTREYIGNNSGLGVHPRDYDPYPTGFYANSVADAQIRAELKYLLQNNPSWDNNVYNVFLGQGEGVCITSTDCYDVARSEVDFCAYHSQFTAPNGVMTGYSVVPNNTSANCNPPYCPNGCVTDSALDDFSHESIEAETDPFSGGWYDSSGNEIGDKCTGQYGYLNYSNPPGTYWNFHWNANYYIIQMLWDNSLSTCVQTGP